MAVGLPAVPSLRAQPEPAGQRDPEAGRTRAAAAAGRAGTRRDRPQAAGAANRPPLRQCRRDRERSGSLPGWAADDGRARVCAGESGNGPGRRLAPPPRFRPPRRRRSPLHMPEKSSTSRPADSIPTEPLPRRSESAPPEMADAATAPPSVATAPRRANRMLRALALVGGLLTLASEGSALIRAEQLRTRVPALDVSQLTEVRNEYRRIERWTPIGLGTARLRRPLTSRMLELADRTIFEYRTDTPALAQAQWDGARRSLDFAMEIAPSNTDVAGRHAYVRGQLARIAGSNDEAVRLFRNAARLMPDSPDPYLGLATVFAYSTHDLDGFLQAIRDARKLGYTPGRRVRAWSGDLYTWLADRARSDAKRLEGTSGSSCCSAPPPTTTSASSRSTACASSTPSRTCARAAGAGPRCPPSCRCRCRRRCRTRPCPTDRHASSEFREGHDMRVVQASPAAPVSSHRRPLVAGRGARVERLALAATTATLMLGLWLAYVGQTSAGDRCSGPDDSSQPCVEPVDGHECRRFDPGARPHQRAGRPAPGGGRGRRLHQRTPPGHPARRSFVQCGDSRQHHSGDTRAHRLERASRAAR